MFDFFDGVCYTVRMEFILTPDQQRAKDAIIEWYLHLNTSSFVLTGYAGTGKTSLLQHVVCEALNLTPGKKAAFVAPTGKAASILIRSGTPASTIHSLIYKMEDEEDFSEEELSEESSRVKIPRRERLKFVKRKSLDEDYSLIVVDESSMVSEEVIQDLLSFGVKCLFCGDSAQLPPVNGATTLLSSPDSALQEITRVEKENPIVALSNAARKGEYLPFGNYGSAAIVTKSEFVGERRKKILMQADQVICGKNSTRKALNEEIRSYLGFDTANPLPTEGEKLICTLNNWEKTIDEEGNFHLVNGIIGYCSEVEEKSDYLGTLSFRAEFLEHTVKGIPFDEGIFLDGEYAHRYGEYAVKTESGLVVSETNFAAIHNNKLSGMELISRFEFAYAITCHKAQGSEFDFVVVFDESRAFGEDRAKWLYTAITRAKKRLLIVR